MNSIIILVLFSLKICLAYVNLAGDFRCGKEFSGDLCPNDACCSAYGYCGVTGDYCNTGCQSNCINIDTSSYTTYNNCKKQNTISLTFDDGPSVEYTGELLKYLSHKKIKATFFITGQKVFNKEIENIVKMMHKQGHTVGIHTWSHPSLVTLDDASIILEITRTADLIKRITGENPKYFRPPYLDYNNRIHKIVTRLGYKTVMVNLDSFDWKYYKEEDHHNIINIYNTHLKNGKEGYISLMHDPLISSVALIDKIVRIIKENNYKIITLDKCLDWED